MIQQKAPLISELVTVTSILFALMLSFSAAGVWNDWLQAQNAVQREALALDNVLALADGLPSDRGGRVKDRVLAYAKAAAAHEWPAMARQADMDDASFGVSERILSGLTAELSREAGRADSSPVAAMLLPQIFEARSARLARLAMSRSAVSGAQWFALIALIVSALVVLALIYNKHAGTQVPRDQCVFGGGGGGVLCDLGTRSPLRRRHIGQPETPAGADRQGQSRNSRRVRNEIGPEVRGLCFE